MALKTITVGILTLLLIACSRANYVIKDIDHTYNNLSLTNRSGCLSDFQLEISPHVPYGYQYSLNSVTGQYADYIQIDMRAIAASAAKNLAGIPSNNCPGGKVGILEINSIKHETESSLDVGIMYMFASITADIDVVCRGSNKRINMMITGKGPWIRGGGILSGNADIEQALVRTSTHAMYDVLIKAASVCAK